MTVINKSISWSTARLNLTVGCSHMSAACDFCYAEAMVNRGLHGFRDFETLRFYPERLRDLPKFRPFRGADGLLYPHLVFVDSMSDFWHEQIPDDFIHNALDAFELYPTTIFPILTKRAGRMRRFIYDRYGSRGVPAHIWLGVTCEDNRVKRLLDILRYQGSGWRLHRLHIN
jgi:protein gp37